MMAVTDPFPAFFYVFSDHFMIFPAAAFLMRCAGITIKYFGRAAGLTIRTQPSCGTKMAAQKSEKPI